VTDEIIRTAAVVAAAALVAAPYWPHVAKYVAEAAETARRHWPTIGRAVAACLLIAAAWGKIPLPTLLNVGPVTTVVVETPTVEMQRLVTPVADAMRSMPAGDRMLWARTWNKAAVVVAGDAVTTEVVFTDTRSLRGFTVLALDIAWRRIGQHAPGGNEPLRAAVEAAYGQAIGTEVVPVTADLRARYAAFAKAVAWAGVNGG
jgi:hypothetical protein